MLVAHPNIRMIIGTCDAHVVGATAAAKRQGLDKKHYNG
jgi:ABC-type sugar transport system substrate-binding protein